MAGIDDVARAAGVSASTASRALNGSGGTRISDATVQRVKDAARALGYTPSSSAYTLATGRNRSVGVVLPHVERWYFSTLLAGIESHLMRAGYDTLLYGLDGSRQQRAAVFDDFLPRRRVDALITASIRLDGPELDRVMQVDKPVLSIGGPLDGAPTLSIDNRGAGRLATEHLIALGHTRIGMIGGEAARESDPRHPEARRDGYRDAMAAAGLDAPEDRLFETDFDLASGYAAAKHALSDPRLRLTALFAASDEIAIGAILAARDLGLSVPRDVSIIGIDGHDLAEFFGLTTLAQWPTRQGARAAELVLDMLAGRQRDHRRFESTVDLLVRSTTARPSTLDA